jgi:hypothetical protein
MKLTMTTYCSIVESVAKVNGETLFEGKSQGDFLKALYEFLAPDYPKFYKMDDLSRLGMLGVELILRNRPDLREKKDDAIALVLQNEMSSLQSDTEHQGQLNRRIPSPATFVYTLPNIVIGELSIRNKWYGESVFFVGERAQTRNLVNYTKSLILTGKAELGIVGIVESFERKHFLKLAVVELDAAGTEFTSGNLNAFVCE